MTLPAHDLRSPSTIALIREADVPAGAAGGEFRYSRGAAALVAGSILGGGALLVALGRMQDNPFAYYIAALLFAFLWIYQTMVIARFRPTNWLVRVTDRGLYVKFRSYLNHHFPEGDPTVVYIPFRDMRLTRAVREVQAVPDTDGRGTLTSRRTVVEIELKDDAPEVDRALAAERRAEAPKVARWYGSSTGKYRHYPVRMAAPRTIAIEWGVLPRAARFLAAMAVHAPVESAEVVRDFTALGALQRHEQESRLLELIDKGQVLDAVRLARTLYDYNLTQAKQFIEELSGRARA
jgi:hypothetical protein